jgi:magnesium-protoporphyrin O-methyltransferase
MPSATYAQRRGQLEVYFDRTAAAAWSRLTSDAPVSRIRATVRAGRETMRETLLGWLPQDLRGCRLLDAGCGTGALAVQAARRGAQVTAIDLSETLVALARERAPRDLGTGSVRFLVGDMLAPPGAGFDYTVAMDSLIHYQAVDAVEAVTRLAAHSTCGVLFTFAPRTPMLAAMHAVGRLFPKGNRAPSIEPIGARSFARMLAAEDDLSAWRQARTHRVESRFYISQALEIVRR